MRYRLLSDSRSITKIDKTNRVQTAYMVVSLALAHAKTSGHQSCANSSPACETVCVGGSGVGLASVWPSVMAGRVRKSIRLAEDRAGFLADLRHDIANAWRQAQELGVRLAVRLNCFSDHRWETPLFGEIPQEFTYVDDRTGEYSLRFYDYTRLHHRTTTPPNYSLTYSWGERPADQQKCIEHLHAGRNVSITFATRGNGFTGPRAMEQRLPKRWTLGGTQFVCVDGDISDIRMPETDGCPTRSGHGRIIALRLKAATNEIHAHGVDSGFCIVQD